MDIERFLNLYEIELNYTRRVMDIISIAGEIEECMKSREIIAEELQWGWANAALDVFNLIKRWNELLGKGEQ